MEDPAAIRNHEGLLELASDLEDGQYPNIKYLKTCTSMFTLKRVLQKKECQILETNAKYAMKIRLFYQ